MTITEAEIRTALDRAVEQADRSAAPMGGRGPSAPSHRPSGRVLLAVAVLVLVVVAGVALAIRDDGERVRTGSPSGVTQPPASSTTSLIATTTPVVPPASVRVGALNGSAVSSVATLLCGQLAGLGYSTCVVDNAWKPFDRSAVFYAPGQEGAAKQVAGRLGIEEWSPMPPEVSADQIVAGSDVVVVVGADGVTVSG